MLVEFDNNRASFTPKFGVISRKSRNLVLAAVADMFQRPGCPPGIQDHSKEQEDSN
jgi:hypothetical protein